MESTADTGSKDAMNAGKGGNDQNAGMKSSWRIWTYSKPIGWVFIAIGSIASLGGGVTMPLMNIVFGQVVGDFSVLEGSLLDPGNISPNAAAEMAKKLTDASNRNTIYGVYHNLVTAQHLMMGEHAEWVIEEEALVSGSDKEADLIKPQAKDEVKSPSTTAALSCAV